MDGARMRGRICIYVYIYMLLCFISYEIYWYSSCLIIYLVVLFEEESLVCGNVLPRHLKVTYHVIHVILLSFFLFSLNVENAKLQSSFAKI